MLVTRGGELFTWGSGQGGKLGLGHTMDACAPQRVHTLWGQSIKHVAAGGTAPQLELAAVVVPSRLSAPEWYQQVVKRGGEQSSLIGAVVVPWRALPVPAASRPPRLALVLSPVPATRTGCACRLLHGGGD